MSLPERYISPNEIQRLKPNKSSGYDLITNKMLKYIPKKLIILLAFIYNSMLRLFYFPVTWKRSIIILIHKPGKSPNVASSYSLRYIRYIRSIRLLPVFAKFFEKLVLKRIRPIVKSQNIIPNAQFGFRARHSTIQ